MLDGGVNEIRGKVRGGSRWDGKLKEGIAAGFIPLRPVQLDSLVLDLERC